MVGADSPEPGLPTVAPLRFDLGLAHDGLDQTRLSRLVEYKGATATGRNALSAAKTEDPDISVGPERSLS